MTQQFQHKGRTITVTAAGEFEYPLANGATVRKPSLKAAQTAIDKEAGQVVVLAMTSSGKKLEIAGKPKGNRSGWLTPSGSIINAYGGPLLPYNEEVAAKLEDIRQREYDEKARHEQAQDALREERRAIYKELGTFDYDAEVAKTAAQAPENPNDAS